MVQRKAQLVADGVRSFAITGKHFTRIYTDDIITLKDRISNAESESRRITSTKSFRTSEPREVVIFSTQDTWHKQGHLQTHA